MAQFEITSFTFMLDWVPDPVCQTYSGNSLSRAPLMTSSVRLRALPTGNPCDSVKPPKKQRVRPKGLTLQEAVEVIQGLRDHWLYTPVVVATLTGMRRGELLGLRWADVDLRDGIASLQNGATEPNRRKRNAKGEIVKMVTNTDLKTHDSHRDLPIATFLTELLTEQRARLEEASETFGWRLAAETPVFPDVTTGRLMSPDAFSSKFNYEVAKRELPKILPKGLRTSFASALRSLGTDTMEIAQLMGHTTDRTTKKHYLMEDLTAKRRAVKRLDKTVQRLLDDRPSGGQRGSRAPKRESA